jgi:ABC-type multidrug transport system fused ATPase/permease subunit
MKDVISRVKEIYNNLVRLVKIAAAEDRLIIIGYFATSLLGVIFLFGAYFAYKLLIDSVAGFIGQQPQTSLFVIVVTYLFFEYVSRLVYSTINQYYFDYLVRSKFQNRLTRQFMHKLSTLDFTHLEDGDVRNRIARIEDTYMWRVPENLRTINNIIYSSFGLITALIIALQYNLVYFFILALASAPLYYLRVKYSSNAWSVYSGNAPKTNYLWYLRYLFINFPTLSEMKIYHLQDYFLNKTKEIQAELIGDYKKPIAKYTLYSTFASVLIPVVIYFSLTNFISQIGPRGYTIGDFTFFLNTLFTFSNQISNILFNLGAFYENSLFVNDYFDFLGIKNTITEPVDPYVFPDIEPVEIKFVDVSFKYPNTKNFVLKKINLVIKKSEDVAIVGHNGAGKTTLIKLLLRFYDPTQGAILIDGIDLRTISIENWYYHLSILFQDFARYNLSLRENIEFGDIKRHDPYKENINRSLSQAQACDLLKELPKGLNQILGRWFEGGQELSTGQWQKVAIARTLYRSSPVLILDEPTANIDVESEYEIFTNLKNIYKEGSMVFVSHRFSTVRMADRIYVIEGGQVIEEGTHHQLLEKNGTYARFFRIQKKGYE